MLQKRKTQDVDASYFRYPKLLTEAKLNGEDEDFEEDDEEEENDNYGGRNENWEDDDEKFMDAQD